MGYELVRGADGLGRLADTWQALEDRARCQVFQTYSFASLWQRCVGDRVGATPLIVTHTEDDGVVRSLFPACTVPLGPIRLLTWLSAPYLQDYGDVVRDPAATLPADEFIQASLALLRREARTSFLYLTNVREDAVAYPTLASSLRPLKHSVAPYVTIEGDFESFIRGLPRDNRRHVQRAWRRASEAGEIHLEIIDANDPRLDETLTWLFARKLARFKRRGERVDLRDTSVQEFRRATAHEQPDTRVARVTLDGELLATEIVAVRYGRLSAVVTAFDESRSSISPGRVLYYLLVNECFNEGLSVFDLCWGGEPHKYIFTDKDVRLTTFVSSGLSGRTLQAGLRTKRALDSLRRKRPGTPIAELD